jgi:hypothetical protein|tara:strand:+ start:967 stop:1488 length:522 start_codon:yes stop_codon:yes gene_type:complete
MKYPAHKPFLKDSMGRYRTNSLFHEWGYVSEHEALWTLKEEHPTLPSLRQLYMDIADPTEYEFAMQAFGSWKHWLRIKANKAIAKWIEDWPIELEVKLRSKGIQQVIAEATEGKSKFNAAKAIAEGFWTKQTSKRGRPSKDEVQRELKIASKLEEEFQEDAERIGLKLVKGSK